jgi:hypothetical protein
MNAVLKTVAGAFGILTVFAIWLIFLGFAFRVFYACFMFGWGLV